MCIPSTLMPARSATIAIVVSTHEPKAAATRSVGEKLIPSPPLSRGASVTSFEPDSTFSLEAFLLWERGAHGAALAYVALRELQRRARGSHESRPRSGGKR